jgi:hypothetical protein
MLLYQAALSLSSRTLNYIAWLIRAHRRNIRSRWRAIDSGQQALLTLAYLHQGHTRRRAPPPGRLRADTATSLLYRRNGFTDTAPPDRGAPGTGHRAPGTGHRAPGTGHRAPGTGHRAPGTGHRTVHGQAARDRV